VTRIGRLLAISRARVCAFDMRGDHPVVFKSRQADELLARALTREEIRQLSPEKPPVS